MNTALVIIPGPGPSAPPPRPAGPRLLPPVRPVETIVDAPQRERPTPWRGEPADRRTTPPRDSHHRRPPSDGFGSVTRGPSVQGDAPSALFMAQLLAQQAAAGEPALSGHRDGPALVSETYRRAGGDPPLYSSDSAVFRFSV